MASSILVWDRVEVFGCEGMNVADSFNSVHRPTVVLTTLPYPLYLPHAQLAPVARALISLP
eukprot:130985-Hanusia_phi.AAC.2